jgi:hypothetical protein
LRQKTPLQGGAVPNDLVVVAALFACSLLAAVVLFKVLKSTAVISRKEYQVGGAAAGFLVIYFALFTSYHQLQGAQLTACKSGLLPDIAVQGLVMPPLKNATLIVGHESAALDDSGRFFVTTRGEPQSLHIITGDTHISHTIWPGDDLRNVKIP